MRIGLQIPQFDWPGGPASIGASLAAIAGTADDAGFASIWVMDHFFQMEMGDPKRAEDPMLESYTALGFHGRGNEARAPGNDGHRRELPPARPADQGGHDA